MFLVFEKKIKISSCVGFDFPSKTIVEQMLFSSVFLVHFQKYWPKQHLWVYCFKSRIRAKTERKHFWRVFFKNQKYNFGGLKNSVSYSNLKFYFICLLFYANFHQKILIYRAPGIKKKWKLWCACGGVRHVQIGCCDFEK